MRSTGRTGFSLVEVLVVAGILILLSTIAAPAVSGIVASHQRTRAINEIADLVELARNEAMTGQCYSWIGFEAATDSDGNDELRAVVLAPPGGVAISTSQGTTMLLAGVRAVTKTFRWKNLKLEALSKLEQVKDLITTDEPTLPLADQKKQGFRLDGASAATIHLLTITFTPQGHALLVPRPKIMTPYARFIDIGLVPTREGQEVDAPDQAALVLNGFSGRTEILRR